MHACHVNLSAVENAQAVKKNTQWETKGPSGDQPKTDPLNPTGTGEKNTAGGSNPTQRQECKCNTVKEFWAEI